MNRGAFSLVVIVTTSFNSPFACKWIDPIFILITQKKRQVNQPHHSVVILPYMLPLSSLKIQGHVGCEFDKGDLN